MGKFYKLYTELTSDRIDQKQNSEKSCLGSESDYDRGSIFNIISLAKYSIIFLLANITILKWNYKHYLLQTLHRPSKELLYISRKGVTPA